MPALVANSRDFLDHPGQGGTFPVVVDRAPAPEDHAQRAEIRKTLLDATARVPVRLREGGFVVEDLER
jgi:hypothetical protein